MGLTEIFFLVFIAAVIGGAIWGALPRKWHQLRPFEADSIDLFEQDEATKRNEYEAFVKLDRDLHCLK